MNNVNNKKFLEIGRRISRIIKSPRPDGSYGTMLVKQDNLIAVPIIIVEGSFPKSFFDKILQAASFYGHSEIVSLWTGGTFDPKIENEPEIEKGFCISIPATESGVADFYNNRQLLPAMTSATFSGKPDWVFFHAATAGNDYDVLVGTEEVIQLFKEASPQKVFQTFEQELENIAKTQALREYDYLIRLKQELERYNSASAGTEVIIE